MTNAIAIEVQPQDVLNRLNIIDVQIKSFSGYMTRDDEVFEAGDEILFTKGSIKIIDPAHVKSFTNSRVKVKRICSAVGVSLAGGFAVSDEHTKDVIKQLIEMRSKFYHEKALFLQNYDAYVEEQALQKPERYDLVKQKKPSLSYVDGQLQFEIRVYKMVAAQVEGVDNYINNEVGDLKWQLAKEIAQDVKSSWKGKDGKPNADWKTVGMLTRIKDKLKSLAFLDARIVQLQNFLGEVVQSLPKTKITGRDYVSLIGVIEILSDPHKLLNEELTFEVAQKTLDENVVILPVKKAKKQASSTPSELLLEPDKQVSNSIYSF